MAEYLGPDEPWPKHSRPEAREALDEASDAGWSFRKSAGHAFGRITCPAKGSPDACIVVVFSTSGPADGSETAKAIRRGLRKCRHAPKSELADAADEERLSDATIIRRVEQLLRVANGLAERNRAMAARDEALDRADEFAFDEADRRIVDADNTAQTAWDDLGRSIEPWPPAVATDELLDDAERFVAQLTDSERRGDLHRLIDRLRP
ncbi:MAG: hypothetical protein JJU45_08115 [Acidimicrobiia bacterium]|nr:hypothetical protein [Acidimicrobiia bacterium]